ncbi:hypothetical protein ACIBEJ_35305 [Nonomuraea sp. NPDC050790]|uniref:hypothetical protein n=1 Tax=Nonomuraea sp. NPDC050790 TaxID=3364371 RepID=UPI0037A6A850
MIEPMTGSPDMPADPGKPTRRLWRSREERAEARAAARTRAAELAVDEQRAIDQREMERLEAQREHDKVRQELQARHTAQVSQARLARRSRIKTFSRRVSLGVVLAGANGGVNAAAVLGQVLALTLGLGWTWQAALPVALVVESVAVNVGYFAHDKLIKGYSAIWLRLLSYGIGGAVGVFNYTHNAAIKATADFALVFGGASLLSPVLWQIYSQWRHWETLREQDLLEPRAPSFGLRWLVWFGETLFIWRRAVRYGVTDRADADARFRPEYEARKRTSPVTSDDETPAAEVTGERQPEDRDEPSPGDADADTPPDTSSDHDDEQDASRERPDDQDNRVAEVWIRRQMREGKLPTQQQTADKFGFSKGWARLRVQAARDFMTGRGYRVLPGNIVQPPDTTVTANGSRSDHDEDRDEIAAGSPAN